MNKNVLVVVVLVAVIAVAAILFANDKLGLMSDSEDVKTEDKSMMDDVKVVDATPSPTIVINESPSMSEQTVKEFTVLGTDHKFSLNEIKVKKGDKVRIIFKNEGGFHDWVVDEFNARTKQIKAEASETIEFIADKTGTFEYYCSVGKHRQMGMKGNLIVE